MQLSGADRAGHAGEGGGSSTLYGHRYAVLTIVLVSVLMAVIDSTVVNIALPTMTRFFAADLSQTQWTITAYLITMTSLLLVFGKVSEYAGRARMFLVGIAIFTGSSLACGLSGNLAGLVLFRVLQGTGAAMIFSISSALIFATTPPDERGRAMGYLGSTVAVGSIVGPILGGFIVDSLGWEYIFFINVPIGIVLILASVKYLRFDEVRTENLALDWHGSAAMVLMFVSLIIALGNIAEDVALSPVTIAAIAIFVASLALFIRHERKCPAPLVDLSIFSHPAFFFPLVALVVVFVANFMMTVAGPFFLEGVMGYRPAQVGMIFLITPAFMVIMAPIAGWLYDRRRTPYYATLGTLMTACAFFILAYSALTMNLAGIIGGFVMFGIGFGFFQTPNNTAIMSALPAKQLSVASSVTATARNLGMALGVSFGSILISVQLAMAGYSGEVLGAAPPVLASTIAGIMTLSGVLCVIAAMLTLKAVN